METMPPPTAASNEKAEAAQASAGEAPLAASTESKQSALTEESNSAVLPKDALPVDSGKDEEKPKPKAKAALSADSEVSANLSEPKSDVRENEHGLGNQTESIPSVEELEKQAKFWKTNQILEEMIRRDKEKWFLQPVDAEALGLADYHNIVKQPMDLGTIKEKFDAKKYDNHVHVLDHIRLTFRNAILYNPADSYVSTAAVRHLKRFEGMVRKSFDAPEDIGAKIPDSNVTPPTSLSERLNDAEAKQEIQGRPELVEVALFLWLLSSSGSLFKVHTFTLQELELSLLIPETNKVMACVHTVLLLPFREIQLLQKSGFSDFERPIEWWVKQLLAQLQDWNQDRNELRQELEQIKSHGENLYIPEQVDNVKARKDFVDYLLRPLFDGEDDEAFEKAEEVLPFSTVEEYVQLSPTKRLLILRSLCEWRGAGFPESSVQDHFRSFELESLRQPPIGLDHEGRRYYYFPQFYKDCRVYRETPMEEPPEEVETEEEEEDDEEEEEAIPVVPWRRRQKIDAVWSGDGEFYPGKIKRVNEDGTYNVLFDDGDTERNIPHDMIRKHKPEDFEEDEEEEVQVRRKSSRTSPPKQTKQEAVRRSPRGKKRARSQASAESTSAKRSTRRAKEEASQRLKETEETEWWKESRRRSSRQRSKPVRIEEEIYGAEAVKPKREKRKAPVKAAPKKSNKAKDAPQQVRKQSTTPEPTYPKQRFYDGPEGRASKWELLCEDVDGLGAVIKEVKGMKVAFNKDLIQELADLEEHMKSEMENLIKEKERMEKRLKQSLAPRKRSSRIAESKLQKMQQEEEEKRRQLLEEERMRQEAEEKKKKKLRAERMKAREEREIADALLRETNRRRREQQAATQTTQVVSRKQKRPRTTVNSSKAVAKSSSSADKTGEASTHTSKPEVNPPRSKKAKQLPALGKGQTQEPSTAAVPRPLQQTTPTPLTRPVSGPNGALHRKPKEVPSVGQATQVATTYSAMELPDQLDASREARQAPKDAVAAPKATVEAKPSQEVPHQVSDTMPGDQVLKDAATAASTVIKAKPPVDGPQQLSAARQGGLISRDVKAGTPEPGLQTLAPAVLGKPYEQRVPGKTEPLINSNSVAPNGTMRKPSLPPATNTFSGIAERPQRQPNVHPTPATNPPKETALVQIAGNGIGKTLLNEKEGAISSNSATPAAAGASREACSAVVQAVVKHVVQTVSEGSSTGGENERTKEEAVKAAIESEPKAKGKLGELLQDAQDENRNTHYHSVGRV